MRFSDRNTLLAAVIIPTVLAAKPDVSKGEDIIPLDSNEAAAFHHSDKAVKTSPKDKTAAEDLLDGDTFRKSEPKLDYQKIDVPDTESLNPDESRERVVAAAKSGDDPIVLNDYDPNNLGVTTENKPDLTDAKSNRHGAADGGSESAGANNDGSAAATNDESHKKKNTVADGDQTTKGAQTTTTQDNSEKQQEEEKDTFGIDDTNHHDHGGSSHFNSFSMSFSMILFSEVGDKTFLIAALMAMRHQRITVFSSAFSSLIVMTILSAFLGHALPHFLPKKVTSLLAAVLFVVFGIKLFREAWEMDAHAGVDEELEEVEHEIEAKELIDENDDLEKGNAPDGTGVNSSATTREKSLKRATSSPRLSQDGLENGSGDAPLYTSRSGSGGSNSAFSRRGMKDNWTQIVEGVNNLASLVLSPVWVQVFVMTFLGEWGDRSQVATIAMAAGSDYWFVIIGAIAGHGICTAAAVLGGKLLATRISMRHVTMAGAAAFLIFAIIYLVEGISLPW